MMNETHGSQYQYVLVWEFRVRSGYESQFQEIYGTQGGWAQLFMRAAGFVRTELLRDEKDESRYVTMDYWRSREDYDRFRQQHEAEYRELDQNCEQLTKKESLIGSFRGVPDTTISEL